MGTIYDTSSEPRATERSGRLARPPARRLPLRSRTASALRTATVETDAVDAVRLRESRYRRSLVVADLVATLAAVYFAVVVLGQDQVRGLTVAVFPVVVATAKLTGLYDRDELVLRKTTIDELPKLFQLATLTTFLVWLLSGTILAGYLGQGQAIALWVSLTGGLTVSRAVARRLAALSSSVERVMVLGDAATLAHLRDKLEADAHVELVGSVPFEHVVDDLDLMRDHAKRLSAHRLILAPGHAAAASPETVQVIRAAKATGLRVSLLPGVLDVVGSAVEFDSLSGTTLLGVRRFGLSRSSLLTKRALDVALAGLVVAFTAPLMLAIAIAIRLDSPGPLLFRQSRIGRDGSPFEIIKFRSMVDGADAQRVELAEFNEAPDGLFKIAGDPRITRVGSFLRRSSLDELPQLLNVLRGEMSLVGPRPLIADEDRRITGTDRLRLQLTPGMTGQWQIAGSARVPLTEMVKIDYLYVAGWSLWSDVKILIRTAMYVLGRRGQ